VLWRRILRRDGSSFASPRPPDELDPQEVEHACARALRLGEFWASLGDLGEDYLPRISSGLRPRTFSASRTDGIAVSDVRILPYMPTSPHSIRLVTASKGIWSTLVLWEVPLGRAGAGAIAEPRELARWTCRGGIFRGLVVNEKPGMKELIAISVAQDEYVCFCSSRVSLADEEYVRTCRIEILSLQPIAASSRSELQSLHVIRTPNIPTALSGHRLAHSDAVAETTLTDLRSGKTLAVLRSLEDRNANFGLPGLLVCPFLVAVRTSTYLHRCQNNAPSHVLFVRDRAIVVRARSLELFNLSTLNPAAAARSFMNVVISDRADAGTPPVVFPDVRHSFGWVDHIVLALALRNPDYSAEAPYPPIHILVRAKPADVWHPDPEIIEHHVLHPACPSPPSLFAPPALPAAPSSSSSHSPPPASHQPYRFPPVRTHILRAPFKPATPRCRTLLLGPRGSALLVSARDTRSLVPASLVDTYSVAELGADAVAPSQHGRREALLGVGPASLSDVCERWPAYSEADASGDQRGDHDAGGDQRGDAHAHAPADRPTAALLWNERGAPWSCADYDERAGVVVLGGGDGSLTVLDLVA
jgi:hypothetical protein